MLPCLVKCPSHPRRTSRSRHCDANLVFRPDFRPFFSYACALLHFPHPLSPLLATHTKTAGCVSTIPILEPNAHAPILASRFRLSTANLMSFPFILLRTL